MSSGPTGAGFDVDPGNAPAPVAGVQVGPPPAWAPDAFRHCMASKGLQLPDETYFKDWKTTMETFQSFAGVLGTLEDLRSARGVSGLIVNLVLNRKAGGTIDSASAVDRTFHYASAFVDCCLHAGAPEAEVLQMRGTLDSISGEVLRNPPVPAPPGAPTAPPMKKSTAVLSGAAGLAIGAVIIGGIFHFVGANNNTAAGNNPSGLPAGFPSIPAGTYDLSACVAAGSGSYNVSTCRSAGVASGDASAIAQAIANTDVCAGISGSQSCSEQYTGFNGAEFDVLIDVTSCDGGSACGAANVVLRVQRAP